MKIAQKRNGGDQMNNPNVTEQEQSSSSSDAQRCACGGFFLPVDVGATCKDYSFVCGSCDACATPAQARAIEEAHDSEEGLFCPAPTPEERAAEERALSEHWERVRLEEVARERAAIFAARGEAQRVAPRMGGLRAEIFARFWVARFGADHSLTDGYFAEWARRFEEGREWWSMDEQGARDYLRVLSSPWEGTARAVYLRVLAQVVDEVEPCELCGSRRCTIEQEGNGGRCAKFPEA
jgi:hypothetical protein